MTVGESFAGLPLAQVPERSPSALVLSSVVHRFKGQPIEVLLRLPQTGVFEGYVLSEVSPSLDASRWMRIALRRAL